MCPWYVFVVLRGLSLSTVESDVFLGCLFQSSMHSRVIKIFSVFCVFFCSVASLDYFVVYHVDLDIS